MFKLLAFASALILFNQALAQNGNQQFSDTTYNLGFEKIKTGDSLPAKWHKFNQIKGYKCFADTQVKHGGKQSLLIEQTNADNVRSICQHRKRCAG